MGEGIKISYTNAQKLIDIYNSLEYDLDGCLAEKDDKWLKNFISELETEIQYAIG